ncbi:bluetail domain-containing putative surface protein [Acidovorax sp.]|uniref:bluetail domain-containing putative surface protein n=1 Tax=Acidovorax sp. TaxID=1872122 RepID=UPI003A101A08
MSTCLTPWDLHLHLSSWPSCTGATCTWQARQAALAASTAGANKAIAFGYGSDTYIVVNDATAALGSQDGLVRLNGVPVVGDGDWPVV